jgi:hypothetical protein
LLQRPVKPGCVGCCGVGEGRNDLIPFMESPFGLTDVIRNCRNEMKAGNSPIPGHPRFVIKGELRGPIRLESKAFTPVWISSPFQKPVNPPLLSAGGLIRVKSNLNWLISGGFRNGRNRHNHYARAFSI